MMGSRSVRWSHQTVSVYTRRQWFPNIQQSRFLTACRRLEKLVLPSIFDTSLSSLMTWNLQSYPTTVLNEKKWHFRGVKTYSDCVKPPAIFCACFVYIIHIFRGQDPQPPGPTPLQSLYNAIQVLLHTPSHHQNSVHHCLVQREHCSRQKQKILQVWTAEWIQSCLYWLQQLCSITRPADRASPTS